MSLHRASPFHFINTHDVHKPTGPKIARPKFIGCHPFGVEFFFGHFLTIRTPHLSTTHRTKQSRPNHSQINQDAFFYIHLWK